MSSGAPMLAAAFPEAGVLGERLRRQGLTISCAESCTGGLLMAALTALPGASDYVLGGVITYSDELKQSLLHVPEKALAEGGAVSAEVATAMAEGVLDACGSDLGLAVAGVAGPQVRIPDESARAFRLNPRTHSGESAHPAGGVIGAFAA
ncbi:MAG: CinA family protein [Candidatus Dormibacteria bacterium]